MVASCGIWAAHQRGSSRVVFDEVELIIRRMQRPVEHHPYTTFGYIRGNTACIFLTRPMPGCRSIPVVHLCQTCSGRHVRPWDKALSAC